MTTLTQCGRWQCAFGHSYACVYHLVFRPTFMPESVGDSNMRVRVKMRCVLEIKDSKDVVLIDEWGGNQRLDDTKYLCTNGTTRILEMQFRPEELEKAYSITLDIQWQIIFAG